MSSTSDYVKTFVGFVVSKVSPPPPPPPAPALTWEGVLFLALLGAVFVRMLGVLLRDCHSLYMFLWSRLPRWGKDILDLCIFPVIATVVVACVYVVVVCAFFGAVLFHLYMRNEGQ